MSLPPESDSAEEGIPASLRALAQRLQDLNHQATDAYAPLVEELIRTRSHNTQEIERTLDGLLSFCGHPPALLLYRRLCRHLWDFDQAAAANYVRHYREMWNEDEDTAGSS